MVVGSSTKVKHQMVHLGRRGTQDIPRQSKRLVQTIMERYHGQSICHGKDTDFYKWHSWGSGEKKDTTRGEPQGGRKHRRRWIVMSTIIRWNSREANPIPLIPLHLEVKKKNNEAIRGMEKTSVGNQ